MAACPAVSSLSPFPSFHENNFLSKISLQNCDKADSGKRRLIHHSQKEFHPSLPRGSKDKDRYVLLWLSSNLSGVESAWSSDGSCITPCRATVPSAPIHFFSCILLTFTASGSLRYSTPQFFSHVPLLKHSHVALVILGKFKPGVTDRTSIAGRVLTHFILPTEYQSNCLEHKTSSSYLAE